MSSKALVSVAVVAVVACVGASSAQAQWTVTNLHPAGATQSRALAAGGTQQAGFAVVNFASHASLWSGTAASWVDLHPEAALESVAWATDGNQQAGVTDRASLWSGTAASWVDLHPAGANSSQARAIDADQQGGWASFDLGNRAGLWSGTAASWVDLHPAAASSSRALASSGDQQVGVAVVNLAPHASLWSGSAASWVDLHAFLPAEFVSSEARGISTDGINVYVSGYGYDGVEEREEALLWTVPEPGASALASVGGLVALTLRRAKTARAASR